MAELKTKKTEASVETFLSSVDEKHRADAATIAELMQKATGAPPKLWGTSIVGFGDQHYKYASGREGDWFITGFSPRKANLTLYILNGFPGQDELLEKLGKYKHGKGCLYINSLEDVHLPTLKKLIAGSVKHAKKKAPG
jgi:hypothetical protein